MSKSIYGLIIALLLIKPEFSKAEEPSQNVSCKSESFKLAKRPQEPTLPYPYDEEEVSFKNPSDGVILSGTLTLPRSKGPFPVAVLLHGSAPFDRNSSHYGHKPFLVWADHLTRQGIAVLRFDKRSVGKSTGNYDTATVEDFASDALAGVEYLKTRKEVNENKIGLIGYSEGGITAPLVASKSKNVAFIVLMAAPAVNWEEIIFTQEALILRVEGASEEMIAQSLKFRKEIFDILKKEKNQEIAEKKMREVFTKYQSKLTALQKQIAEKCYGPIEAHIKLFNSTWFRYAFTYDPLVALKRVKVPVLALNGELDFVVFPEQNLSRIGKSFEEVGHKDYTVMELPKLNHSFQTCQTGSLLEYSMIEETISPLALKIMSKWILERTVKQEKKLSP